MVPGSVKSAARTIDIVERIARFGPATARELARATRIPESSLSYLLATLVERNWLCSLGDRTYALGSALSRLTHGVVPSPDERRRAQLRLVSRATGETCSLFVRRGIDIEATDVELSSQLLRFTPEKGMRVPLHAFAAGKALLAQMSGAGLDAYFAAGTRTRFTAATLVEEAALRRDIVETRARGYAISWEEHTPGIVGMGVAASDQYSLSVAVPTARFDAAFEKLAAKVLREAVKALGD
ncbi:MAG: IclR family transcriptional regulator [Hyphomicrobiaceae bacterium]|nr:IclR family transcriptional regulator [Hyphomicrobiaceae bacterium]